MLQQILLRPAEYSVIATLFPYLFPHQFRGHGDAVPVYFEAAAVISEPGIH